MIIDDVFELVKDMVNDFFNLAFFVKIFYRKRFIVEKIEVIHFWFSRTVVLYVVFLRTFSRMVSNEIAMEYITSSPLTNTFLNEIFFYKMYRKGLLYIHSSHLTFFSCVSSILASRFMIYIYTEEKFIQRQ